MGTQPPPKKGRSPQFSAHVCCGQTAAWIRMPIGMEVGLGPDNIVLDGDPAPPPQKGGRAPRPQFSAHAYCGQTAKWIRMALGMEVKWALGPSFPLQKGDRAPQFLAHFYCGQTAGCIKMPLGMEVGLSPGDFVLDGDPAPLPKRGEAPNFRPTSVVAKRLDASRCHLVRR